MNLKSIFKNEQSKNRLLRNDARRFYALIVLLFIFTVIPLALSGCGRILVKGLTATAGNTQVVLNWSPDATATSYNVYKSLSLKGKYIKIASSITATTYTVTGLTNGTTYYFEVTGVNSAGEISYSVPVSATPSASITAPSAPTGLTATSGNTQVSLSWTPGTGATSYNIYESTTSGGPYTKVGSSTTTSYTVTGLTNGTAYYFVVTGVNSVGESGYSNQASSTPAVPTTAPSAPTGLTATAGNAQVALSWNTDTGATSYNIYQSTSASGTYTKVNSSIVTTTSYTATGLTNGTAYYFEVTGVNSVGESGYSNQASSTPSAPTGTISFSGTVMGGTSPLVNVTVSLYEIGNSSILTSATTGSTGNYSLSYTYPSSTSPTFYVVVTPTTAANGTNGYSLMNLYTGDPTTNINELTTAETTYALNEASGSISSEVITVSNITNFVSDYNAVIASPNINNNEIYYIADSLAYCVQNQNINFANIPCYMISAFTNSTLSYTKGSGNFTLLAAQNYSSLTPLTAANIQTAAYGSYYAYYKYNGPNAASRAPFQITPASATPASTSMNVYLNAAIQADNPGYMTANIPYVNVYINGSATPIHLLIDTGATGIMINQSALTSVDPTLPESNFNFSGGFLDGTTFSGYISYANVSTSGGLIAQNIPIAVATTDTAFPSTGFLQGDFGMGLAPTNSFAINSGTFILYTPSFDTALPSSYNSGFTLDFNNITFTDGYNETISDTTPVGTITYGLSTPPAGSNFYPNAPVSPYLPADPYIQSEFGGLSSDPVGNNTFYSYFDTGTNFIDLGKYALDDSISGFAASFGTSGSPDVYDVYGNPICNPPVAPNTHYTPITPAFSGDINGGLVVVNSLLNSTGAYIANNVTSGPDAISPGNTWCYYNDFDTTDIPAAGNALATDNELYYTGSSNGGQEGFGLPFIFNQPMYWQALSPTAQWGVGIEP
jgi:fibronectin type 3 domain-containing protein